MRSTSLKWGGFRRIYNTMTPLFFFSIFFCLCLVKPKICGGVLCDANCQNCYQCNPSICNPANNCFCASKNPPGGLSLEETPQFIVLTIDDSALQEQMEAIQNFDWLLKNPNIADANNCQPKISSYVTSNNMDYNVVNWENRVGTTSLHTITHTTGVSSSLSTWTAELTNNYNAIKILGDVKDIPGSRAPYLETNDAYFSVLTRLNILYDSTFEYNPVAWNDDPSQQTAYWPFTLDHGFPEASFCINSVGCPTIPVHGLWEVPIVGIVTLTGQELNAMNIDPRYLEDLKADFIRSISSNRVPRGFYSHYSYFTVGNGLTTLDTEVSEFTQTFFEWLSFNYKDNILFATEKDIIDWMKDPQPLSVTKTLPQFQCRDYSMTPATTCDPVRCGFMEGYVRTCTELCPLKYPNLLGDWINPQIHASDFHWFGLKAGAVITSDWGTGVCGTISFSNPLANTSKSAIITINSCGAQFMSFWGANNSSKLVQSDNGQLYRAILTNINVPKGGSNNLLGFCANVKNGFKIFVGVDLYAVELSCNLLDCQVFCGDGTCSGDETEENCPYDCAANVCIRNGVSLVPDIESATPSPTSPANHWFGGVTIRWGANWGTGVCADISVTNKGSLTAVAYVMTIEINKLHASITSFWGLTQAQIPSDANKEKWRQIENYLSLAPGTTKITAGLCISYNNLWDPDNDIRFGVDLYSDSVNDPVANVRAYCGDGVCGDDETFTNCPVDCNPLV